LVGGQKAQNYSPMGVLLEKKYVHKKQDSLQPNKIEEKYLERLHAFLDKLILPVAGHFHTPPG
jgi:hypothetical protein